MDKLKPAEYKFTFAVNNGSENVVEIAHNLHEAYAAILEKYGEGQLSCVDVAEQINDQQHYDLI